MTAGSPSEWPLRLARVNSQFETGIRSPLDTAILQHQTLDTASYQKVDEVPFDFERRRLSVVVTVAGETTRRLLEHFGSVQAVKEADAAAFDSCAGSAMLVPDSAMRRSGLSGPTNACWPTYSSSVRGRMR